MDRPVCVEIYLFLYLLCTYQVNVLDIYCLYLFLENDRGTYLRDPLLVNVRVLHLYRVEEKENERNSDVF